LKGIFVTNPDLLAKSVLEFHWVEIVPVTLEFGFKVLPFSKVITGKPVILQLHCWWRPAVKFRTGVGTHYFHLG